MEAPKPIHLRPRQIKTVPLAERGTWNANEFLNLTRDIKQNGMRVPIRVRKKGATLYEIIDGKKRFVAAYLLEMRILVCLDFTDVIAG